MAKAVQLPSGTWRVIVYDGKDATGKKHYKSLTAPTEKEANLLGLEHDIHHKEISRDSSTMTVGEAVDAHIKSESNILSPSTIAGYRRSKKRLEKLGIASIKLNRITTKKIEDSENIHRGNYSEKTVYNDFGLLQTIMNKYRPDFQDKIMLPEVYPTIMDIPGDDDLRKIYALAYGTEMEIPILLGSWLGFRESEICGLKLTKTKNGRIIVDNVKVAGENDKGEKGIYEKKPKSKKGMRALVIPEYIQGRMDVLIPEGQQYITDLSGQAIYKRFVRLCKKAEVGPFRFHDLRHANATIMLDENIPDKYIKERGGWGSDIYKKRYEHTTEVRRKSVDDAVDSHFEKIVQPDGQHERQHDGNQIE